jgi:hypothetical protein
MEVNSIMKVRIVEVEGTREEVESVLDGLRGQQAETRASVEPKSEESEDRSPFGLTREIVETLWAHWGPGSNARRVIEILVQQGGTATQNDLHRALGLQGDPKAGRKLAGVLASITNNAKRIARRLDGRVIEGGWGMPYRLPADALALFRDLLNGGQRAAA